MNKERFIRSLDNKLSGLVESERLDIIEEYTITIDEKIANGMSEEEAVVGFGDIDLFVSEILDTYKSDKSYVLLSVKNKMLYRAKKIKNFFKWERIRAKSLGEEEAQQTGQSIIGKVTRHIIEKGRKIVHSIIEMVKFLIKGSIKLVKYIWKESVKIAKKVAELCIIMAMTFSTLFFGFSLIFTIAQFPAIGLTIVFMGITLAFGIAFVKVKRKIVYYLGATILVGVGCGVVLLEFFSLKQENFIDYLEGNPTKYTVEYDFRTDNPLTLQSYFHTEIEVVYDETMEEGEIVLTTTLDQDYFLVSTNVDHREEITEIYLYMTALNTYHQEYLYTFFWKLKEKILLYEGHPTLEQIVVRVHPNTEFMVY
ncbi:MAG: hypothetical protein R3Y54_01720 [Eubacteriales bacterium]